MACVGAVGRTAYAVNVQPCRHVFHFRSVHDTHDRINNTLLRYGIGRTVKQSETILAVAPVIPNNRYGSVFLAVEATAFANAARYVLFAESKAVLSMEPYSPTITGYPCVTNLSYMDFNCASK